MTDEPRHDGEVVEAAVGNAEDPDAIAAVLTAAAAAGGDPDRLRDCLITAGVLLVPEVLNRKEPPSPRTDVAVTVRYRIFAPAGDELEAVVMAEGSYLAEAIDNAWRTLAAQLFGTPLPAPPPTDPAEQPPEGRAAGTPAPPARPYPGGVRTLLERWVEALGRLPDGDEQEFLGRFRSSSNGATFRQLLTRQPDLAREWVEEAERLAAHTGGGG